MGVRVAKGGQHRRPAQVDDLVIGRQGGDELPVPDAELLPALPARKGQHAVFVQRFHAPSIARGAENETFLALQCVGGEYLCANQLVVEERFFTCGYNCDVIFVIKIQIGKHIFNGIRFCHTPGIFF